MAREAAAHVDESRAGRSIALAVLLGFFAQLSFALDLSVALGLVLYSVATYLFVQFLPEDEFRDDSDAILSKPGKAGLFDKVWFEWLLVFVLLLITSLFRFYRLDSNPFSLSLDEGLTGLNALEIIEGAKNAPLWGMTPLDRWKPDWVQTSNLYLHYVVLVFKLFGSGYFGLKMVSVLPAVASVPVIYFLFKECANVRVAFLAAFLTAVSQWHVTISRWGWDAVLMGLLQLIAYRLLIRGVKTGNKLHFAASGGLIGLCLYTYIAAWIALSIAISFLILRALGDPQQRVSRLRELSSFLAACFLAFAPLGAHYFKHPGDLTIRVSEVSLAKAVSETNSYIPLWENFKNHALMFNYKGDKNPRHSFPNEPVLDFVTSVFFILGLACCVRFWKRLHNLFLLLWFGLGIQGGLLADPLAAPHAYRTMMIIPVICFFAATSLSLFFTLARQALARLQSRNMILLPVCIALLGYVFVANYWTYFVKRPKSSQVWEEEGRDGGIPARISSYRKESALLLVDPLFLWKVVVVNTWILTYRPGKLFEPVLVSGNLLLSEQKLAQYSDQRQLIYFYPPEFTRMIRSLFPEEPNEAAYSPSGEPLYGIVKVNLGALRERLRSADKRKLADALANIALFYGTQLRVDAEVGPRRQLLVDESNAALAAARQLTTR